MKKALVMISCIALIGVCAFAFFSETEIDLAQVPLITQTQFGEICGARNETAAELLCAAAYGDYDLPNGVDSDFCFPAYAGDIRFSCRSGYSMAALPTEGTAGGGMRLLIYNKSQFRSYDLRFTQLPMIDILLSKTASAEQPIEDFITWNDGDDWAGRAVAYEYDEALDRVIVTTYPMEIKRRGNFSKTYPKSSYTLKPSEASMEEYSPDGMLGLGRNARYALNALYADDSKIRTLYCMKLWESFGAKSNAYGVDNGVDGRPVELFINGRYWGLYAFSETLNEAPLACEEDDIVYKIVSENLPTHANFGSDRHLVGSAALIYNTHGEDYAEEVFFDFFNVLYYADDETFQKEIFNHYDRANAIDYYIFTDLLFACDNIWNNGVLTYKADDGHFLAAPWDLDLTLGSFWTTKLPLHTMKMPIELDEHVRILSEDGVTLVHRLWEDDADGFRKAAAERWFHLREGVLSEEALIASADAMFNELTDCGARARDAARWPESAAAADNAYIRAFLGFRLQFLDDYFGAAL